MSQKETITITVRGILFVTSYLVTPVRSSNGAKVTPLVRCATRFVSWCFGESRLVSLLQEVAVKPGGTMKRYTKSIQVAMLVAAGAVMAAGCGDTRVASKENLAVALNHDYQASQDCLFAKPMPFPYQVAVNDKLLAETRRRLDALAEAGLLEREQNPEGGTTVNRYVLTAAGSQTEGKGRFCYGRRQVTSVEKFTPPVDYQGMPLTKVEYHFVLKNAPSWAKEDEVRSAFPSVAKATSEQPVDEATLLLTHDGWVLTY
jgi:hypothetical protein